MSKKQIFSYPNLIVAGMVLLVVHFIPPHVHSQSKVAEIEKLMRSKPLFNGVILVSERGKVIFQRGFGFANFEWKIPNTTNTQIQNWLNH